MLIEIDPRVTEALKRQTDAMLRQAEAMEKLTLEISKIRKSMKIAEIEARLEPEPAVRLVASKD